MKMLRLKSRDIDERIGALVDEIQDGKRDPNVRKIAGTVLAGEKRGGKFNVPARDWRGEAVALFNYVRDNVRYTRDIAEVELYQRPIRSLEIGIGDCDDLVILLGSLLQSVGYPIMIKVIGLKGSRVFQHVYLLVGLPPNRPAEWLPLDPSRPEEAGWQLEPEKVGLMRLYEVED